MSNSNLISFTSLSPNCNKPRNHAIDTVTIHCFVGQVSIESMGHYFASELNKCSANYGIGSDGRIGMFVEEVNRSWCSSSSQNDNRAITIECACDSFHPYKVNDSVLNSLIALLADVCKRNGIKELKWSGDKSLIGQVDKQNMTVHRWFKNKACPGEYLYNLHGTIADRVNEILNPKPIPQPEPIQQPIPQPVQYNVGSVYTVIVDGLRIRKGAGTNFSEKSRNELSVDGRKHADYKGHLLIGTEVTCKEVAFDSSGNTWIRIPSGWACAIYNGVKYIQ